MKRLALLLALSPAPTLAAERNYSVTDYDRIRIEGPYEVTLATGTSSRARAFGDQAALDRITIEVQAGMLKIHPNRSAWGGNPGAQSGPVKIELGTRALKGVAIVGSSRLAIDTVRGIKVDLSVSGSGRLDVAAVHVDSLVLASVGAGTVALGGTAKQLRATVQGSAALEAETLRTDDAVLSAETSGKIAFRADRTARIAANGLGEVRIAGTADCTVTGSAADVHCGK